MPDHQTIIMVGIAVFIVGTSAITVTIKVWPILRKFVSLVNDLGGEKERPGVPARPGIMERMASVEEHARSADFHSKPNHGTSAYDNLRRDIREHMAESTEDRQRIWTVLNQVTRDASQQAMFRGQRPPTAQ